MAKEKRNEFFPDLPIPPGDTLLEVLEEREMSQAELAEKMGRPKKTINEIIKGKAAITAETAIQLERVLNIPARFWRNLQMNYEETLARIKEKEALAEQLSWLRNVPVREMVKLGWIERKIDPIEQLETILSFFGVASITGWMKTWEPKVCSEVCFRKSDKFEMQEIALAAWLRRGQIEASEMECEPFNSEKFEETIPEIKKLTTLPPEEFVPKLKSLCSKAGVAVVFVHEIPKVPVSGATHWMSTKRAIIQLSLRYKTDDHLWFSFFHEAGHVLMHGKRDFYDNGKKVVHDVQERQQWEDEANAFSARILIPDAAYNYFVESGSFHQTSIELFAKSHGISPGIVLGRLQHDKIVSFSSKLNHLKARYQWA